MTWKRTCEVIGVLIATLVALGRITAQAAIWWLENAHRILTAANTELAVA